MSTDFDRIKRLEQRIHDLHGEIFLLKSAVIEEKRKEPRYCTIVDESGKTRDCDIIEEVGPFFNPNPTSSNRTVRIIERESGARAPSGAGSDFDAASRAQGGRSGDVRAHPHDT